MWNTCGALDERARPVAPVGPLHGDPQLYFNETSAKPLTVAHDVGVLYATRELAAATQPRLAHADLIDWRENEGVRLWAGSLGVLDVDVANEHAIAAADAANRANLAKLKKPEAGGAASGDDGAYRKPAPLAQRDENDGHYYAKARVPHPALAFPRARKERVKTPPRHEDARATGPRRWAGQALAREAPRRGAACGVRFAGVVVPCGRCSSCVGGGNVEPDFAVGYPLETACPSVESRETCVRADLAVKRSGARAAVLMSDTDVARVKRALAAPRQ